MSAAKDCAPAQGVKARSIELVVLVPFSTLIAASLLGFGVAPFVLAAVAMQLAIGAGYAPVLWRASPRWGVLVLGLTALALFGGAALALPRVSDALTTGREAIALLAALTAYLLIATATVRERRRAIWGMPLGVLAAYAVLLTFAAAWRYVPPPGTARGTSVAGADRLLGADSTVAGTALATAGSTLLVGAPEPGATESSVYAIDAQALRRGTPLARIGHGEGWLLQAADADKSGFAVADAGDQNGDGLSDYLVGAPYAENAAGDVAGTAYVVYARPGSGVLHLGQLAGRGSPRGYRLEGPSFGDRGGYSVTALPAATGHGAPSLVVGVPRFDRHDLPTGAGAVYVVRGGERRGALDLARLYARGQAWRMISDGRGTAGMAVASVGDVNGDGIPDLLVGARDASPDGRAGAGGAWLVYGREPAPWGRTIDLGAIGEAGDHAGIKLIGAAAGDAAGTTVSATGDVNGDGLADVAVGAPTAAGSGRALSGSVYVVYGRRGNAGGTIDLARVGVAGGHAGYRIDGAIGGHCPTGAVCGDETGLAIAPAGDVNGDGRGDLVIGAPLADGTRAGWAGATFVVYGQSAAPVVDLHAVGPLAGPAGFRVDGLAEGERSGSAVAVERTPTGKQMLVIGAPFARLRAGTTYVLALRAPTGR